MELCLTNDVITRRLDKAFRYFFQFFSGAFRTCVKPGGLGGRSAGDPPSKSEWPTADRLARSCRPVGAGAGGRGPRAER